MPDRALIAGPWEIGSGGRIVTTWAVPLHNKMQSLINAISTLINHNIYTLIYNTNTIIWHI